MNTVWKRRLGAGILVLEAAVVGLWTDLFVRMWFTSAAWDDESTTSVWLFSGVWTLLTIGIPLAAAVVLWLGSDRHQNQHVRVTAKRALFGMKCWQLLAIPLTLSLAADVIH